MIFLFPNISWLLRASTSVHGDSSRSSELCTERWEPACLCEIAFPRELTCNYMSSIIGWGNRRCLRQCVRALCQAYSTFASTIATDWTHTQTHAHMSAGHAESFLPATQTIHYADCAWLIFYPTSTCGTLWKTFSEGGCAPARLTCTRNVRTFGQLNKQQLQQQ